MIIVLNLKYCELYKQYINEMINYKLDSSL